VARETRTIVLINGSASMLFYWSMLLKRLRYKVVSVRSAEEALGVMERTLPSVVLTDIPLPGMDGAALLKAIKGSPLFRDVPVVMLTSLDDPAAREACTRMGCSGWFGTDVEPDKLYPVIQSLSETVPRRHIRLAASLTVFVGDGTAIGGAVRTEQTSAISEGGLFVRTRYPQPQNALTPVRVVLNGSEIRAKAVVVYSSAVNEGPAQEPGMGLKFVEITDQDRRLIRLFIKEQLTGDLAR